VKADVAFDVADGEPLVVNVGISAVDEAGAAKNLDAEMQGFDFDAVRDAARESWRTQLGKIEVHGGTDAQMRTFYTALYHCCVAPNVFSDVDGRYRGRDLKVHQAKGWTQYTVFSLWDTFRALHPLMTILEPERTNDFVNTFLAQYREGGALPVWELAGNETDCMIGYHAVPVIADAYAKGIRGYDARLALDAMVASAKRDVRGLPSYRKFGFVAAEEEGESVSKTLEYAYDDWCIASMARAMGRGEVADEFDVRAQSWKNLFDPSTGFFRPRRNDTWIEPFDPAEVNFHLTEANSWQYSMFVPHDVGGLAKLLGGREAFAARLDALFTAPSQTKGRDQADISGMIGQYAHGNEPSHHMAWLYDYAGQPWKSQERVRQILDTLYTDKPDGLCGNEDCGQMSAWYVLSAMGLYPVCPGRPEYDVGSPLFREISIHLGDGRTFALRSDGIGPYVRGASLGGAPLETTVLAHEAILRGGSLDLTTSAVPTEWGVATSAPAAVTGSYDAFVVTPFVVGARRVFDGEMELVLGVADRDASVWYALNEAKEFKRYEAPVRISATTSLSAYAARPTVRAADGPAAGMLHSKLVTARFVKIPHDWKITLAHPYAPQYAANGERTLIDGLRGGSDFRTGDWQGFQGVDLDATIDLGAEHAVTAIQIGFLQEMRSWIWMPTEVRFLVSTDGKEFRDLGEIESTVDEHSEAAEPLVFRFDTKTRARFVRVVGKNRGVCPPWHPGAGHQAWLFADEIGVDLAD
jgi:hypothetical protein